MKKRVTAIISLVLAAASAALYAEMPKTAVYDVPQKMPFKVYEDGDSKNNHYLPTGWMGDIDDMQVDTNWGGAPRSGKTCIKVRYNVLGVPSKGWAGILWQDPDNNWGDKKGGYNLSKAKKLTFWARGEKGDVKLSEVMLGGMHGRYRDTDSAVVPIELTNDWKQYTINLKGKNLNRIVAGFGWAATKDDNPDGFTMYIDDIQYE